MDQWGNVRKFKIPAENWAVIGQSRLHGVVGNISNSSSHLGLQIPLPVIPYLHLIGVNI